MTHPLYGLLLKVEQLDSELATYQKALRNSSYTTPSAMTFPTQHHNNKPVTSTTMNEPTLAAPSAQIPMTIERVEALARELITVPIGSLAIHQTLQTGQYYATPVTRWAIGHFPPNDRSACTQAEGATPLEALLNLIEKLKCAASTPSA